MRLKLDRIVRILHPATESYPQILTQGHNLSPLPPRIATPPTQKIRAPPTSSTLVRHENECRYLVVEGEGDYDVDDLIFIWSICIF
jgi:hypothetical protein